MKVSLLFIIVAFIISFVLSQSDEGDDCTTKNGRDGICKKFALCPKIREEIKINKTRPTICSFQNIDPIVCCPVDVMTTTTIATTTTEKTRCEFPITAFKVPKKNKKAWDKCIDLAEYIWPCRRSGSSFIREDTCKFRAKPLILGGLTAGDNEFPHMAALGYDNPDTKEILWDAGGTLISESWVLTAAHCTWSKEYSSHVKHVRLGGGNLNIGADAKFMFTISKIVVHPKYTGTKKYNDIALIKLDREVKYSKEILPACLHTGNSINDRSAIATGYGTTKYMGEKSKKLRKVVLEKFTHENCSKKYSIKKQLPEGIKNETQLCYGSDVMDKDTCQGDSGGPLQIYNLDVYCTYSVIGITSFGLHCGIAGVPAVYTRVSAYIPWIESIVWP